MTAPARLAFIASEPWALLPGAIGELIERATRVGPGDELHASAALGRRQTSQRVGQVEVIDVRGFIGPRPSWSNDVSTWELERDIRAALSDPAVNSVVLAIDSPGGNAVGIPEFAEFLRWAGTQKPLVAVASSRAASAAYWIGSQASSFHVQPSGDVGSIGVVMAHVDQSRMLETMGIAVTFIHSARYKVEGNSYQPLTDEARTHLQERCDAIYKRFVDDVAVGRKRSSEDVTKEFGEGRMVLAPRAAELGMVDGVATLNEIVARLNAQKQGSSLSAALKGLADSIRTTKGVK